MLSFREIVQVSLLQARSRDLTGCLSSDWRWCVTSDALWSMNPQKTTAKKVNITIIHKHTCFDTAHHSALWLQNDQKQRTVSRKCLAFQERQLENDSVKPRPYSLKRGKIVYYDRSKTRLCITQCTKTFPVSPSSLTRAKIKHTTDMTPSDLL